MERDQRVYDAIRVLLSLLHLLLLLLLLLLLFFKLPMLPVPVLMIDPRRRKKHPIMDSYRALFGPRPTQGKFYTFIRMFIDVEEGTSGTLAENTFGLKFHRKLEKNWC